MLTDYPSSLECIEDGNVLTLDRLVLSNKIKCGLYIYTKSKTKLGQELLLNLYDLNKLINNKILKTNENK
jgi:hypothetical protein